MAARRFPWRGVVALWAGLSLFLVYLFWQKALTLNFDDPDDFMRLQQVRDVLNGQSWFDLKQYRIAPPEGLATHWSRLVDLPLLAFLLPLRPLVGAHMAEVVTVTAAPLLTLLVLMAAMVAMTRRLLGHDRDTAILASLLAMSAPTIYQQIHPARIDHHGWQIALAAVAIAALMQRNARRSGIVAGIALGLYLNISLEGAPFVAAALGIVSLQWALGQEDGIRFTGALWALAVTTIVSALVTVPTYRWTEGLCDAVGPAHMAALAVSAMGSALIVRYGNRFGPVARIAALGALAVATLAAFGAGSTTCLGSPFGNMDPVVSHFWYNNVVEGMPVWRQDALSIASMIGFPLIAIAGSVVGWMAAKTPERRRRWAIILVILVAALATGAMVRRAAAIAQVVAIPGALVLIGMMVRFGEARFRSILRSLWTVLAILGLSPPMPVVAVAAFTAAPPKESGNSRGSRDCTQSCAMAKLATLPAETMMTGIDLGPALIARTPHSAFGAGYHRLERPLHNLIRFFQGTPEAAEAFMRRHHLASILIDPTSEETKLFIKTAPDGLMARLARGQIPAWLVKIDLGSKTLARYRIRDPR
jgi:hypothetical protein